MQEFLLQTYTIILPIALGYIVWLAATEERQEREWERNHAVIACATDRVSHEIHAAREIPSYAYQNFEEMYEAYHDLGGNGMVKKMYEEIKELHIKSGGGK